MPTKTWGPFTGRQLTTIIVASILVVGVPGTAWAIDTFSNVAIEDPVSGVKATVDSTHALLTAAKPKPPTSPFFLGGQHFSDTSPVTVVGPTSSFINVTSVSAAMRGRATDSSESNVQLVAAAVSSTATDCSSPISVKTLWESGKITASGPAEATFPAPLEFRPPTGEKACLQVEIPSEANSFVAVANVSGYLGS